jgi:2-oxoglutarate dehydrogenase complex dehydrogenase (E1) component-like enzyme
MKTFPKSLCALALSLSLVACGEAGSKTADVVQAATRGAAEIGQQLAEKAAELAKMAPEEAKAKLQGLLDGAARELKELKDSETAQRIVAEFEQAFDKLVELAKKLGEKLDLAGLKNAVVELVERFKNDPRVTSALESLKSKLDSLTR